MRKIRGFIWLELYIVSSCVNDDATACNRLLGARVLKMQHAQLHRLTRADRDRAVGLQHGKSARFWVKRKPGGLETRVRYAEAHAFPVLRKAGHETEITLFIRYRTVGLICWCATLLVAHRSHCDMCARDGVLKVGVDDAAFYLCGGESWTRGTLRRCSR